MMEYIIAGMAVSIFIVLLAGAYLIVRDKQAQWEADQDYKRMQQSIKQSKKKVQKNDSSRIG
jgi:hypothetical protein